MFSKFLKPVHFMLWDTLISPRWHKVINDFWYNKARLGLAVLSITVGVFALGTVMAERVILLRNIEDQFQAAKSASASMRLAGGFDDGLVKHVRRFPSVAEADAVRTVELRVLLPPSKARGSTVEEWRTLNLYAIDDFDDIRLNYAHLERGVWPPAKYQMVLERSSMKITGVDMGDSLLVETMNGLQREMPVVGVVKDVTVYPGELTGNIAGYISFDTLNWLEEPRRFNKLFVRVRGDDTNKDYVDDITERLRKRIELDGWMVSSVSVPQYPGRPIIETNFKTMVLILHIVGLLLVGISGIMVANTMDALIAHEIKQIGIMRIVGGQLNQVMTVYFAFAALMGTLAMVMAVPLSFLVSRELCKFVAGMINYDILETYVPAWVFLAEAAIAYLVAILASLKPILSSTLFLTVREAISPYGLDGAGKPGLLDQFLGALRGLASPVMLSLRNTFRKKWRLGLTLVTLSMGGGIFIAMFCLRSSLLYTAHTLHTQFTRFDLSVSFSRPYNIRVVQPIVEALPEIERVEGWRQLSIPRVRADGSESDPINVIAAPAGTPLLKPDMEEGRWLDELDDRAVVVNKYVLDRNPDLHLGGEIVLKYNQRETSWRIVGMAPGIVGVGQTPLIYVNYEAFANATKTIGMVDTLQIVTHNKDETYLTHMAEMLDKQLNHEGYAVRDIQTAMEMLYLLEQRIGILTQVLTTISMLLALVGGISLTSTMGINVLERTREIGVMRAVGASSGDLLQITITEACIVGWISWVFAGILAVPLGRAVSYQIGLAFMNNPLMFAYSYPGLLAWFGMVSVIAVIASLMPAQNAMRITVREAISYE